MLTCSSTGNPLKYYCKKCRVYFCFASLKDHMEHFDQVKEINEIQDVEECKEFLNLQASKILNEIELKQAMLEKDKQNLLKLRQNEKVDAQFIK